MIKTWGFLITLLTILLSNYNTQAIQSPGAELTYQCMGGNSYRINFILYRDCSAIVPTDSQLVMITSSCFSDTSIYIHANSSGPTQMVTSCSSEITTCDGGQNLGIEIYTYQGQITLNGPCSDWRFFISAGTRSSAITTVNSPQSFDLFVYAMLNNTNGLCNNSSLFLNPPFPFFCMAQQSCFNYGSNDTDGDSLVSEIISPLAGPLISDTLVYKTGYYSAQPFISNSPLVLNSTTGEFCFTPVQEDVSVMAIRISEFRNGILVGQVERDFQFTVLNCINNLPSLSGPNGLSDSVIDVCAGIQNCFFISSNDSDLANTTFITWDHSIQTMSFANSNGQRDTAYLCWNPSLVDTIGNPHCITLTVNDDNCSYLGVQSYSLCLNVVNTSGCSPLVVNTNINSSEVKLYPQPAKDFISIETGIDISENFTGIIRNILGEEIGKIPGFSKSVKLNLSYVHSSGPYFLTLINKSGSIVLNKVILISK